MECNRLSDTDNTQNTAMVLCRFICTLILLLVAQGVVPGKNVVHIGEHPRRSGTCFRLVPVVRRLDVPLESQVMHNGPRRLLVLRAKGQRLLPFDLCVQDEDRAPGEQLVVELATFADVAPPVLPIAHPYLLPERLELGPAVHDLATLAADDQHRAEDFGRMDVAMDAGVHAILVPGERRTTVHVLLYVVGDVCMCLCFADRLVL